MEKNGKIGKSTGFEIENENQNKLCRFKSRFLQFSSLIIYGTLILCQGLGKHKNKLRSLSEGTHWLAAWTAKIRKLDNNY